MFLDRIVKSCNSSIHNYPETLRYLQSRLVSLDDVKKYEIGYSSLFIVPKDSGPDWERFNDYSFRGRKFENKLIFPLKNAMGENVGLGGRAISSKDFKIFATDEAKFTGFFFGFFEALPYIYKENKVYVVEGFFDLLAMQKIYPNTIAALTASLNNVQYQLLRFYCDNIIVFFDSDKTGDKGRDKAMARNQEGSVDLMTKQNVRSICLQSSSGFQGYKDPAKYLEMFGLKAFKNYMQKQIDSVPPFLL
jgi:DNA primase